MTDTIDGTAAARALLLAALVAAVLLSMAIGARFVSPSAVITALAGSSGSADAVIVRELRLPRTAVSLLGGVWFAFAGAAVAAVVVHLLGTTGRAAPTPARLALAGVAVTSLLGALTTAVVLLDRATLDGYRFWVVGSLAGRSGATAAEVAPFVAVGLLLALAVGRGLDTIALGEDAAAALGTRVGQVRLLTGVAVVLLSGATTAAAGPVVFVGLVVPHLVRAWSGPGHRRLVAHAALAGAVLVLLADVAGRVVARPGEIPVGVAVAAVGGPVFVLLVRQTRLVRL